MNLDRTTRIERTDICSVCIHEKSEAFCFLCKALEDFVPATESNRLFPRFLHAVSLSWLGQLVESKARPDALVLCARNAERAERRAVLGDVSNSRCVSVGQRPSDLATVEVKGY